MIISQENKNNLIKSNQCYMVGILAENEQFYPGGDEQLPVTTLKNSNNVIFYIKPLSSDPEPISELIDPGLGNPLYIGLDYVQNSWLIPYTYKLTGDINKKKEMIYEKLKDKLIIFKPQINFSNKEEKDKPFRNAIVVNVEPDIKVNDDVVFVPVPIMEISNKDFEKKLIDGSSIILSDYSHQMFPPEYIICNNYLYFSFPEWKRSTNDTGWVCEKLANNIRRTKINLENSEMDGKIIEVSGVNLIFMEQKLLYDLEENNDKIENIIDRIIEDEANEINEFNEIEINSTSNQESDMREFMFINAFKEFTLRNNLCYSKDDLTNLHTCVKTNPLTILAGMSGTGKSELANIYAKMLKASEQHGTLLFLPISPSFTEPGDILGFLNNTTGLFIPSETGLTDFLIHAKDNPKLMHIVVFDEMNLSQVEYWFSPFISLLERKPEDRRLFLYNPSTYCINKQAYPSSILIGDNVKFIGTVNIDETTKDFSDRLLDRANILNLKKENLVTFQEEVKELNLNNIEYKDFTCNEYNEYQSWVVKNNWAEAYSKEEIKFLDGLHNLLSKWDEQKGVSFRITKKIGEYILNIPVNPYGTTMISKRDAFDIQIKQRLITKIKGTEKKYGKLIGIIRDNDGTEPISSELFNFFNSDEAKMISDFEKTKGEIVKKAKELGAYGYAN
ncbi:McrB family protein [Clostridium beijerinckii]|uniref:McrB family protein n=1 Tax=Clostridium beijerinckii TaxID=1520 RepID=UPI0022DF3512|nr:hypothetical protein [Clostridium beijerinckii]